MFSRIDGKPWRFIFNGCSGITLLGIVDNLEYNTNTVEMTGCEIDRITYTVDESYYTGNSGDLLFNKGYKMASTQIVDRGNRIGRVITNANNVLTQPLIAPSISTFVVNTGAGTIAAGEAVKLLTDPTFGTNDVEPNTELPGNNVAKWDGSGVLYGVAVNSIAASAQGVVQYGGRPLALCDGTVAIAYGDALETNASGRLVKQSSGRIVAYALAALGSGVSQIAVRWL